MRPSELLNVNGRMTEVFAPDIYMELTGCNMFTSFEHYVG
jgi:hypothetical protein